MHPMFMQQYPFGSTRGTPVEGDWRNCLGNVDESAMGNGLVWTPAVDLREEDGFMKFYVALPGLKKEDVTLNFREGCLTISGNLKFNATQSGHYWFNRPYGTFFRSIVFPTSVQFDEIHASMESGILEIVRPKRESTRVVPINGE